ncbi:MAG: hypothetical protein ACRDO8_11795, partial [Nocardioidaceae bacterium]
AGDRLLAPLSRHLAHALTLVDVPPIVCAGTGVRAGCLGAAVLAFEAAGVARADLGWSFGGDDR